MTQELKVTTINFKSLDQYIKDPIIASEGDANGRTLRLIFTQEAAAQFTEETKVYLKWKHRQLKISGYNICKDVTQDKNLFDYVSIWEIHWPLSMLHEGDVLCRIEIVDEISISPSSNFIVHVLKDPNDGSTFVVSDDYSVFQTAIIDLTNINNQMQNQMQEHKEEFEIIQESFTNMQEEFRETKEKTNQAYNMAKDALDKITEKDTSSGVFIVEFE